MESASQKIQTGNEKEHLTFIVYIETNAIFLSFIIKLWFFMSLEI